MSICISLNVPGKVVNLEKALEAIGGVEHIARVSETCGLSGQEVIQIDKKLKQQKKQKNKTKAGLDNNDFREVKNRLAFSLTEDV